MEPLEATRGATAGSVASSPEAAAASSASPSQVDDVGGGSGGDRHGARLAGRFWASSSENLDDEGNDLLSSVVSRSSLYRCRTPEASFRRDRPQRKRKNKDKRRLQAWAAKEQLDVSPASSHASLRRSHAISPALKLPVLPPTTFLLDEVLETVEWKLVQRKGKRGVHRASGLAGSSSPAATRSSPRNAGALPQLQPRKVDRTDRTDSNFRFFEPSAGHKAQVSPVCGLGHKDQLHIACKTKTRGTRPRAFISSSVFGLRHPNPRGSSPIPPQQPHRDQNMAGRGGDGGIRSSGDRKFQGDGDGFRKPGFNGGRGFRQNNFGNGGQNSYGNGGQSSFGQSNFGNGGQNQPQGVTGNNNQGSQGTSHQNLRSTGPSNFQRGDVVP